MTRFVTLAHNGRNTCRKMNLEHENFIKPTFQQGVENLSTDVERDGEPKHQANRFPKSGHKFSQLLRQGRDRDCTQNNDFRPKG